MATTTTTVTMPIYAVGDAGFRLWGKAWHDAMIAAGCTQVFSDIDLDTMIMPTTSGQMVTGSRIYSFDDSLHATHPLFVKLEWGRGNSSQPTNGFKLQISIGWQHDSGVLAGDVFSQFLATHRELTEIGEIVVTRYDAGISLWTNTTSTSTAGFLIERTSLSGTVVGDGATAWNALPYQGIGGRDTASHTTASLAAAAAEDFTLALSKSFALFKVETDVQARVRLYASAAYRTADAARAIGVDPTGDHGLIAEVVTTPSMLSVWLSPVAVGGAADGGAAVYGRIDNTGAGATAVAATLTYVTLEG